MARIVRERLVLDYYQQLFSSEWCQYITQTLESQVIWSTPLSSGRRSNQTYGDDGLFYRVDFGARGSAVRVARPWQEIPLLPQLRDYVTNITGERYNICVVQRYPSGRVGIAPHRDHEMRHGTTICALSFGAVRTLVMSPPAFLPSEAALTIPLASGSLYAIRPPTNDYWAHSIEKDQSTGPRYSLTFRNYAA